MRSHLFVNKFLVFRAKSMVFVTPKKCFFDFLLHSIVLPFVLNSVAL